MRSCPQCKTELPFDWARSTCPECDARLPMPTGRRAAVLSPLTSRAHDQAARVRSSDRPPPASSGAPSVPPASSRAPSVPPAYEDRWDVEDAPLAPSPPRSSAPARPTREPAGSFAREPEGDEPASMPPLGRKPRVRDETLSFFGSSSGSFTPPPRSAPAVGVPRSSDAEQTNRLPRGSEGSGEERNISEKSGEKQDPERASAVQIPTLSRSEKSGEEVTRGAPSFAAFNDALAPTAAAVSAGLGAERNARASHEEITANAPVAPPAGREAGLLEGAAHGEAEPVRPSLRSTRPVRALEVKKAASMAAALPAVEPREAARVGAPAPSGEVDLGRASDRVVTAMAGITLASVWALSGSGDLQRLGVWGVPGLAAIVLAGLPVDARTRALMCGACALPALGLHVETSATSSGPWLAVGACVGVVSLAIAAGRVSRGRWGFIVASAGFAAAACFTAGRSAGGLAGLLAGPLAVLVATAGSVLAAPATRARVRRR